MLTVSNILLCQRSFIDSFARTTKNMLFERVEHTEKDWHLLLPNVIRQYNNTIHDSSILKPVDAILDKNVVEVKTNLMLRARFKIKYKEINVGFFVGFLRTKENTRR